MTEQSGGSVDRYICADCLDRPPGHMAGWEPECDCPCHTTIRTDDRHDIKPPQLGRKP